MMSTTILTFRKPNVQRCPAVILVKRGGVCEKASDNFSQNQKQGGDIISRVLPDGIALMILNS